MNSASIRDYSNLKVYYTENDYFELCYKPKFSPFSLVLEWNSCGSDDYPCIAVNVEALHSFYTAAGLTALEIIPTKAEILLDLFQGISVGE